MLELCPGNSPCSTNLSKRRQTFMVVAFGEDGLIHARESEGGGLWLEERLEDLVVVLW